jgi:hypothetical protein
MLTAAVRFRSGCGCVTNSMESRIPSLILWVNPEPPEALPFARHSLIGTPGRLIKGKQLESDPEPDPCGVYFLAFPEDSCSLVRFWWFWGGSPMMEALRVEPAGGLVQAAGRLIDRDPLGEQSATVRTLLAIEAPRAVGGYR